MPVLLDLCKPGQVPDLALGRAWTLAHAPAPGEMDDAPHDRGARLIRRRTPSEVLLEQCLLAALPGGLSSIVLAGAQVALQSTTRTRMRTRRAM